MSNRFDYIQKKLGLAQNAKPHLKPLKRFLLGLKFSSSIACVLRNIFIGV
jgi:hypothetical protein